LRHQGLYEYAEHPISRKMVTKGINYEAIVVDSRVISESLKYQLESIINSSPFHTPAEPLCGFSKKSVEIVRREGCL
jgi:hypothetical protein